MPFQASDPGLVLAHDFDRNENRGDPERPCDARATAEPGKSGRPRFDDLHLGSGAKQNFVENEISISICPRADRRPPRTNLFERPNEEHDIGGIRQSQVIFDSVDTRQSCARQWSHAAKAFGGAGRFHLGSTVGGSTSHEADRNRRALEFSASSARRIWSGAARQCVRPCLTNARGATARSLRARESHRPSSFRYPEIHPVSGGQP